MASVDGGRVVQVRLGEALGDGVGGLPRVVVRDRAVDVVRHVRRADPVVQPVDVGTPFGGHWHSALRIKNWQLRSSRREGFSAK